VSWLDWIRSPPALTFNDRAAIPPTPLSEEQRAYLVRRALQPQPTVPPVPPSPVAVNPNYPGQTGVTLNLRPNPNASPVTPPDGVRTDVIRSSGGPATDPTLPPENLYPYGKPPLVPPMDPTATSLPRAATPPPVVAPKAFPDDSAPAPAVPYVNPAVTQTGTTLTSNPIDPNAGWGASVGVSSPAEAKAFEKGTDYQKMLSDLDEVAKGLKGNKTNVPSDAATISGGAPQAHIPNAMAAQLLQAMMQSQKRGLTLTGQY
jgi:hypothetical protein